MGYGFNMNQITDNTVWDDLIKQAPDGGFLQSWNWGRFQESLGNPVFNLQSKDKTWVAQCIQLRAGNQFVLSIPRGPVLVASNQDLGASEKKSFQVFMNEIRKFAKEKNCFVIRFDPPYNNSELPITNSELRVKKSHKVTNPEHTLILNTEPSEEELLANMKPKWRYNINLAKKKGVTTRWGSTAEDAKAFYNLVKKTTARQDFASYDQDYFVRLVNELGPTNNVTFLHAIYDDKVIASLLLYRFADSMVYLHGASDYEYRKLMAPHLLQWEAIKKAKSENMAYDFWGVASDPPVNKAEEHWGGVTRFKTGFAPKQEITEYIGTYEIPVKKFWYTLYRLRGKLKQ